MLLAIAIVCLFVLIPLEPRGVPFEMRVKIAVGVIGGACLVAGMTTVPTYRITSTGQLAVMDVEGREAEQGGFLCPCGMEGCGTGTVPSTEAGRLPKHMWSVLEGMRDDDFTPRTSGDLYMMDEAMARGYVGPNWW